MAQVAVRAHCPACGQPATLAGSYSDETFNGQCVACKGVIAAPNPKYDPSKNVQAFSSVVIGDTVVSGYNLTLTKATKMANEPSVEPAGAQTGNPNPTGTLGKGQIPLNENVIAEPVPPIVPGNA